MIRYYPVLVESLKLEPAMTVLYAGHQSQVWQFLGHTSTWRFNSRRDTASTPAVLAVCHSHKPGIHETEGRSASVPKGSKSQQFSTESVVKWCEMDPLKIHFGYLWIFCVDGSCCSPWEYVYIRSLVWSWAFRVVIDQRSCPSRSTSAVKITASEDLMAQVTLSSFDVTSLPSAFLLPLLPFPSTSSSSIQNIPDIQDWAICMQIGKLLSYIDYIQVLNLVKIHIVSLCFNYLQDFNHLDNVNVAGAVATSQLHTL